MLRDPGLLRSPGMRLLRSKAVHGVWCQAPVALAQGKGEAAAHGARGPPLCPCPAVWPWRQNAADLSPLRTGHSADDE